MKYILILIFVTILSLKSYSQKINQQKIYNIILQKGLKHPKIVLRQSIHESMNFKSKAARNKNNVFGIMNGRRTRKFESIDSCIEYYKSHVQSRYKGGNYYTFLHRIKYASDRNYTSKLKNTVLYIE